MDIAGRTQMMGWILLEAHRGWDGYCWKHTEDGLDIAGRSQMMGWILLEAHRGSDGYCWKHTEDRVDIAFADENFKYQH